MRMAIVLTGQAEASISDSSISSVNWPGMLATADAAAEAARLAKKDAPRKFFKSLQPELEEKWRRQPKSTLRCGACSTPLFDCQWLHKPKETSHTCDKHCHVPQAPRYTYEIY
jgi:hypothetical protein